MTIEIQTMLLLVKAPQDNDLQITFDVTATANVREYVGGDCEPGEFLIEDIEIVAVRCWSIRYGTFGTSWPLETDLKASWARLEWLNATIHDRDDWTEAIRIAATREHERQRDRVHN